MYLIFCSKFFVSSFYAAGRLGGAIFLSSDLYVSMVWSNNIVRLPLSPESGGIILWDDDSPQPPPV